MDISELTAQIRKLADELQNIAFILNPEKTTPVFGDLHDYFSRLKHDGVLPLSFETHDYLGHIHVDAREATRDLLSKAELKTTDISLTATEIGTYFSGSNNRLTAFLSGFKDLIEKLPSLDGAGFSDLNPYKRAALGFQNSMRLIDDLLSKINTGLNEVQNHLSDQPSDSESTGGSSILKLSPETAILYKEEEEAYLRKLYTTAEYIISRNISDSVRKKYIDVELFESRYSFLTKDFATESDMKKNDKRYRVAESGPFPYVTLLIFIKEFANVILLSTLAWNTRKADAAFVRKYNDLKSSTVRTMERILAMPKSNLKSHEALVFLRTYLTPLVNSWISDVINPIVASKSKYYEELGTLGRGLSNRINTIYKIEGSR